MTRQDKHSKLEAEIEANLKRAYEAVLEENVPDRFTQLLAQLRQSDDKQKSDGEPDDA